MAEAELVFKAANMLGEGPTWSEEEQALYWVGIIDKKVHRLELSTGAFRTWDAPDFVGTMALRAHGGAIVALASSICLLDFATGNFTELCRPEADRPANRFNDGKCDRQGRFWVGSMQTNLNPDGSPRPITQTSGALWRIDPDGTATDMTGPTIRLSDTLAWSADNRTMYFADSLEQTIYAYDFDPGGGKHRQSKGVRPDGRLRCAGRLGDRRRRFSVECPVRRCLRDPLCARRDHRSDRRCPYHQPDQLHLRRTGPADPVHHLGTGGVERGTDHKQPARGRSVRPRRGSDRATRRPVRRVREVGPINP